MHLHKLRHAGIWRTTIAQPGWKQLQAGGVEHIRSHQLDDNPEQTLQHADGPTRLRLKGNRLADQTADLGQEMHPPLDRTLFSIDWMAYKAAKQVITMVAKVWALYPTRQKHGRDQQPAEISPTPWPGWRRGLWSRGQQSQGGMAATA